MILLRKGIKRTRRSVVSYFNTSASGASAGGASASECEAERGRVDVRRRGCRV